MGDNNNETFKDKLAALDRIRSQLAAECRRYSHSCDSDDLFRDLVRKLEKAQQEVDEFFFQRIRQVS